MSDTLDAEPTSTLLEKHVDALIYTVSAYAYPSDAIVQQGVRKACEVIGMDYIASVAQIIEHTIPDTVQMDVAINTARWQVVEHIARELAGLRAAGHTPRAGILTNGKPCDGAGYPITDDESWDA